MIGEKPEHNRSYWLLYGKLWFGVPWEYKDYMYDMTVHFRTQGFFKPKEEYVLCQIIECAEKDKIPYMISLEKPKIWAKIEANMISQAVFKTQEQSAAEFLKKAFNESPEFEDYYKCTQKGFRIAFNKLKERLRKEGVE